MLQVYGIVIERPIESYHVFKNVRSICPCYTALHA